MSSEQQHVPCVLAFDLGASSGRAFIGEIRSESPDNSTGATADAPGVRKLHITEIHRFPNVPVQIGGHLHWDTPMLLREIKTGIRKAFQAGYRPESCAIDT
ncbi:hypothetical protein ACL02P_01910 [Paenibacillus sp. MB22_1]